MDLLGSGVRVSSCGRSCSRNAHKIDTGFWMFAFFRKPFVVMPERVVLMSLSEIHVSEYSNSSGARDSDSPKPQIFSRSVRVLF